MARTGRPRKIIPFKDGDGVSTTSQKPEAPVVRGDPAKKALIGRRVRLTRTLRNALCIMSQGTTLTITATHAGRFTLRGSDFTEILTGVPREAFEVLP